VAPVVTPQVTKVRSSRPAIIGAVVAIAAIIVLLGVVLARNARAEPVSPPTSATSSPVVHDAHHRSTQPDAPVASRGAR
jgi:hypothetical protein